MPTRRSSAVILARPDGTMPVRNESAASRRDAAPGSAAPRGGQMPAEWARHAATWIAWPHHEPDWPGKLGPIPWVYAEIVRVLEAHERVEILCHDGDVRAACDEHLRAH